MDRLATAADFERIATIWTSTQTLFPDADPTGLAWDAARVGKLASRPNQHLYVKEEGDLVVGFLIETRERGVHMVTVLAVVGNGDERRRRMIELSVEHEDRAIAASATVRAECPARWADMLAFLRAAIGPMESPDKSDGLTIVFEGDPRTGKALLVDALARLARGEF